VLSRHWRIHALNKLGVTRDTEARGDRGPKAPLIGDGAKLPSPCERTVFPSEPEQSLDQTQRALEIDEDELDEVSGAGLPDFRKPGMQPDGAGSGGHA
jgi:hypothetical protein